MESEQRESPTFADLRNLPEKPANWSLPNYRIYPPILDSSQMNDSKQDEESLKQLQANSSEESAEEKLLKKIRSLHPSNPNHLKLRKKLFDMRHQKALQALDDKSKWNGEAFECTHCGKTHTISHRKNVKKHLCICYEARPLVCRDCLEKSKYKDFMQQCHYKDHKNRRHPGSTKKPINLNNSNSLFNQDLESSPQNTRKRLVPSRFEERGRVVKRKLELEESKEQLSDSADNLSKYTSTILARLGHVDVKSFEYLGVRALLFLLCEHHRIKAQDQFPEEDQRRLVRIFGAKNFTCKDCLESGSFNAFIDMKDFNNHKLKMHPESSSGPLDLRQNCCLSLKIKPSQFKKMIKPDSTSAQIKEAIEHLLS